MVSNTGDVHIIVKSPKYSYSKCIEKLLEIKSKLGEYKPDIDIDIVKLFLKDSEKIGIMRF